MACSPREVRTAQAVVRTADSLWQEGKMYDDSLSLAQAYETLSSFNNPLLSTLNAHFSTDYAHACYHYGRLLRQKDDPVTAMQVFINATHSRTRDYHILGRIYSNMGSICHLAGEFTLSYDMYEQSADMFLRNGDTIAYYYGLNDMAYELAEQYDTIGAQILLDSIRQSKYSEITFKIQETQAIMYLRSKQYERTIAILDSMQSINSFAPMRFLMKAQAYEHMKYKDSALYYAQQIVSLTKDDRYLISAYYILSHYNEHLTPDSILSLTSKRADAQKSWALQNAEYANATQLLEQDINRRPDLGWLFAIAATLLIIGTGSGLYIYNRRKKHQLLSQKLGELQSATSNILVKHQELTELYNSNHTRIKEEINQTCVLLLRNKNLQKEIAWQDFEEMCKIIDSHFYLLASKLRNLHVLNETEIRLCVLVLIGLNRAQIADILPYALSSVGKLKDHTAKSLGTTGKNLHEFLLNLALKG